MVTSSVPTSAVPPAVRTRSCRRRASGAPRVGMPRRTRGPSASVRSRISWEMRVSAREISGGPSTGTTGPSDIWQAPSPPHGTGLKGWADRRSCYRPERSVPATATPGAPALGRPAPPPGGRPPPGGARPRHPGPRPPPSPRVQLSPLARRLHALAQQLERAQRRLVEDLLGVAVEVVLLTGDRK